MNVCVCVCVETPLEKESRGKGVVRACASTRCSARRSILLLGGDGRDGRDGRDGPWRERVAVRQGGGWPRSPGAGSEFKGKRRENV